MVAGLRLAFLAVAAMLIVALPLGETALGLGLMVTLDLRAALWVWRSRRRRPQPVVVPLQGIDDASLRLLRRTVPALRMRHPGGVIAAQVHWRHAAWRRRAQRSSF